MVAMTHDELIAKIEPKQKTAGEWLAGFEALRAVVELHKPVINALPVETCLACQDFYPCPTIQAIEKELA